MGVAHNPQTTHAARLRRMFADPTAFASHLVIMDKQAQLVKFNHNRMQRDFFGRYGLDKGWTDLIVKFRQGGATTGIIGECSRLSWTQAVRTHTLMDTDNNTETIREIAKRMYDRWPTVIDAGELKIHTPQRKADNATTTRYDNGSRWVIGTAGSPNAARGTTVDVMHLSECAFYNHADAVINGALQAAGSARWKVWESTTNGAQGKFYEFCMQALDGNKDFRLHFYPWWWADEYRLPIDPDYPVIPDAEETELMRLHDLTLEQINWRRSKQRELGMFFRQEYPESVTTCFLTSGGGFFGDVSKYFTAPTGATRQAGHRYVGGIDWGQSADYTVFSIGDVDTGAMVYRYRVNRMEYPDMIEAIVALIIAWGVDMVVPERNSMSMQVSALREAIEAHVPTCSVQPFTTTNESKRKGIMALHTALNSGALTLPPDAVARAEYQAFESVQTANGAYQYRAAGDGHDDCIIADMLMWRAMNAAPIGVYSAD